MQFAIDRLIEFVISKWTGFVPTNYLFLNPNLGGRKGGVIIHLLVFP